ncbi:MAG: aldose epimerase family protein [Lachnospiraceae bacterium]
MGITSKEFGVLTNGTAATLYSITNKNGYVLDVSDYGAIWVGTKVPTVTGITDVILGFDDVTGYEEDGAHLGATVGRNANRIKEGKYTLEGKSYTLAINNSGNNLHSGLNYWGKRMWSATVSEDKNAVTFSLESADMEQGYPGNMNISVTYTLTDDNTVSLSYEATSDTTTLCNPTNHVYFNLNGHSNSTIWNHKLWIDSSAITETENDVCTGVLLPVAGTEYDFTTEKPVEVALDTNFCTDPHHTATAPRITCTGELSGIKMSVATDMPGIQVYTANFLDNPNGKAHTAYTPASGICFESQHYVNGINIDSPDFKKPILKALETFNSTTLYHFELV